jgi:hypothetical protein
MSLLLHDCAAEKQDFKARGCAVNYRRRPVLNGTPLLQRLAAANIILAYHKLSDDVADGGGAGKRAARGLLRRAYKKAKKQLPDADAAIAAGYARLRALETEQCPSPDRAADCFAESLAAAAEAVIGADTADKKPINTTPDGVNADKNNPINTETDAKTAAPSENLRGLCYNLGRFVYFADALDDLDEDAKHKTYNPFLASFGGYTSRRAFVDAHKSEIGFALYSSLNRLWEYADALNFTQCRNLLHNILFYGIRIKAERLLNADKKLPRERV